jgi:hypothetical protein
VDRLFLLVVVCFRVGCSYDECMLLFIGNVKELAMKGELRNKMWCCSNPIVDC